MSLESSALKAFSEFTFSFAWAEYLNRVSVTNNSNDGIVKAVEAILKLAITHILRRATLGPVIGISDMLFHVGGDFFNIFAFIANNNNHSLAVINPQTDILFHNKSPYLSLDALTFLKSIYPRSTFVSINCTCIRSPTSTPSKPCTNFPSTGRLRSRTQVPFSEAPVTIESNCSPILDSSRSAAADFSTWRSTLVAASSGAVQ